MPRIDKVAQFHKNSDLKYQLWQAEYEIERLKHQRVPGNKSFEYEKISYELQQKLDKVLSEKLSADKYIIQLEATNTELQKKLERMENYLTESRERELDSEFRSEAARRLIARVDRDLAAAKARQAIDAESQLKNLQLQLSEATAAIDQLKLELHRVYAEKEDCMKEVVELKDIVQSNLQIKSELE